MRVAKNWKKAFLPKKREFFYANSYRKDHSTEELRRWIRFGDYKRRKIGWVKVTKSLVTSYQSSGGYLSSYQVTSYQLLVTRRILIRQMSKDIKKRIEEGYLSDNID